MKKTEKEISEEIEDVRQELLNDPTINDFTKAAIQQSREWSNQFQKAALEILNLKNNINLK